MIHFKEEEVCQLLRAVMYYRDTVTGSDDVWDRYDRLTKRLYDYGDQAFPEQVDCKED